MNEELKVSIIVPVHNSEGTLIRCVNSILLQSYKNIECILIENGSIDNSKVICSMYAKKNKNVLYKSVTSTGVSYARNIGLSMFTGDIVGFCDADDFLEVDAISAVVMEFIRNSNIAVVFGGFNKGVIKNNHIIKQYRGIKEKTISISRAIQLNLINDSVMGSVWNKYYRTEFIKNIKFDRELSFCEDMHFNAVVLNAISSKYSVKIINRPLYCYMENSNSVTHNQDIFFDNKDELKYIVALKKIDNDCNLDTKTKKILKMKIACFAVDFLANKELNQNKKTNLINELKKNYIYLIKNILLNNWKWNIKRIFRGCKILMINYISMNC